MFFVPPCEKLTFYVREKGDRLLLGKGDRFDLETEILMAFCGGGV